MAPFAACARRVVGSAALAAVLCLPALALAQTPSGAEPPSAWKAWAAAWMNKTYGNFYPAWGCWPTRPAQAGQGDTYCMHVLETMWDAPAADGGPTRAWLLVQGEPLDAQGQPLEVEAMPMLLGAFVLDRQGGKLVQAIGSARLTAGSSAHPPQDWQSIEVGPGKRGWMSNWGQCLQGHCFNWMILLVPRGSSFAVSELLVTANNEGACAESAADCARRKTDIAIDVTSIEDQATPVYALSLTFSGTVAGRPIRSAPIRVPFDPATGTYKLPPHPVLRAMQELL